VQGGMAGIPTHPDFLKMANGTSYGKIFNPCPSSKVLHPDFHAGASRPGQVPCGTVALSKFSMQIIINIIKK